MPNSLQSSAIASPASRRATNCRLSSIAEHSFQGIAPSLYGRKSHLCVRYNVLPMSQAAHGQFIFNDFLRYALVRFKLRNPAAGYGQNQQGLLDCITMPSRQTRVVRGLSTTVLSEVRSRT